MLGIEAPEPTQIGEVVWLEPLPDTRTGPEAHHEQTESISLAFVTALQLLPPRQLAVLLLRDVLGFPTTTVADMLDTTSNAVNSALKRARATIREQGPGHVERRPPPPARSPAEEALVAKFIRAYTTADLDALVALLTDDVFLSMPPMPFEYSGRHAVAAFCQRLFAAGHVYDLLPTRTNGQPAFGLYHRSPNNARHGTGLIVLTLAGDQICAMTRFESNMLTRCGLPRTLPPDRRKPGRRPG